NALSFLLMATASAVQALLMMIPGITHDTIMLGCGIGALVLTSWLLIWGRSMFRMSLATVGEHDSDQSP
ncbi:MAG: hypothetical protein MK085_11440, partial [Phycisphaerales bacterium]|nr:hypothetical protein [Phycisphaerales bacterium]